MPHDGDPHENPPEMRRTRADLLAKAPMLLWLVLAILAVVGFIVFAKVLGPPL